jgi:hypothetical protein
MNPLDFLVLSLATWRISSLLANEDGAWNIFGRLRYKSGVWYDEYSNKNVNNEFAAQLSCIWCVALWVGAILSMLHYFIPALTFLIALPFAFSTVTAIIHGRGIRVRS